MRPCKMSDLSILIPIFLFPITLWSCANGENPIKASSPEKTERVGVNVRTTIVTPGRFVEKLHLLGETEAAKDVTYSAEIAGRLELLTVDLGDTIRNGQIIARVDYDLLKAQLDQAEAVFNLANKTYGRLDALLKDELITQQQIDEAFSQKVQAEAQLRQARAALGRSVVKSTVNGVVSGKYVESGEYMMPGTPIIRVMDISEVYIYAQIPETSVSEMKPDASVITEIDSLHESFPSEIDVILPVSDPESRTFTTRVKISNPDGRILAGMAASLTIELQEYQNAITVEQDVIIEQMDQRYVFVVDNSKSRKVNVDLGASEDNTVLIKSGLNQGDELIIEGHRNLVDGQLINIMN